MEIYDFISIDFETANEYRDSACQLGITTVQNEAIKYVKSWIINPEQSFSTYNTSIHGIDETMVQGQPTFKELWPEILPYFGNEEMGNIIVAHNATFDINVLLCMLERYNIVPLDGIFLCTLAIARRTWVQPSYSLSSLCNAFNIIPGKHDAGEDSRACAELLLLAAKEKEVDLSKDIACDNDFNDIENKFQVYFGTFNSQGYIPSTCKRKQKAKLLQAIKGDKSKENPDSIFYQKHVVFTGTLSSMRRLEAQQIIADIGGINQTGVNKETDYLIVGQQDFKIVGEDGMSSKQEKAIKMIEKGATLEILSENDFLRSL